MKLRLAYDFACSEYSSNILLVRYEDLVSEKRKTLCKIIDLPGAENNMRILEHMEKQSDFPNVQRHSSNPDFFRSASTDMGEGAIAPELKQDIVKITGDAMQFLDYNV